MSRTILAVVAIVAIAAMMGVASVAPAYAAKKIEETDVTVTQTGFNKGICGVDKLDFVKIRRDTSTIWDNGHYKMSVSFEKKWYAQDDVLQENVIASEKSSVREQGSFGGGSEVATIQDKSKVTCNNGGEGFKTHYVYTLHKDGSVTEPLP